VKSGMILPESSITLLILAVLWILELKKAVCSHLAAQSRFCEDVNEVMKLHQHVEVKVVEVDEDRKRIQLTMIL
jgi:uncharacterized protein